MKGPKSKAVEVVYKTGDDLSILLKTLVDNSGLSRYAIAKAAGITESTLSRMYTGIRPATMETLARIANALGYKVVVRIEIESV
jgi:transcriptional regulator with XRE-family HTH domain